SPSSIQTRQDRIWQQSNATEQPTTLLCQFAIVTASVKRSLRLLVDVVAFGASDQRTGSALHVKKPRLSSTSLSICARAGSQSTHQETPGSKKDKVLANSLPG